MSFRLRPAAETDLDTTTRYIAEDDVEAARRWLDAIERRCRMLGEPPWLGVARDDVRPGLRLLPAETYLILYEITAEGVDVVRVLHGARQWQALLD